MFVLVDGESYDGAVSQTLFSRLRPGGPRMFGNAVN